MPARACARARAASKSSMAWTQARSDVASLTEAGTKSASNVKEDRLVLALEVDVEAEHLAILARHERRPALGVYRGQHGIGLVGLRLVGEIDPGGHPLEQPAREHGHADVRRLHAPARRRHGSRLESSKPGAPLLVGLAAAEAPEIGSSVRVAPRLVRLPDLDQGIHHGLALAVVDRPLDSKPAVGHQLGVLLAGQADVEERADRLRRRGKGHLRSPWAWPPGPAARCRTCRPGPTRARSPTG